MSQSDDKGKFVTEISQEVIDAAMDSVRRRTEGEEISVEPEAPAAPASNKELEELKAQLELSQEKGRELTQKLRDEHEKMLRAVADLDNYKKRAAKEKEDVQKFGVEKLLKDFLPVLDNLDRAVEHAASASDFEGLKTGVAMTRKLFEDALGKSGIKSFSAKGQAFDPRLHEAMQQMESAEVPPGHVALEVARGYMLHDRLVRPAMVVVAKAPSEAKPTEQPKEPPQASPEGGEGSSGTGSPG